MFPLRIALSAMALISTAPDAILPERTEKRPRFPLLTAPEVI